MAGSAGMKAHDHPSRSLGFLRRNEELAAGAVVVEVPEAMPDATRSVCGMKAFLVDERRVFQRAEGGEETVDCAKVALLHIADSPVHRHAVTLETYQVLAGEGWMVLDDAVVPVRAGSLVVIPPGTAHGLSGAGGTSLRVLMTFTPGLAPLAAEAWRDEEILWPSARERIAALGGA